MPIVQSLLGILFFLVFSWLVSENKRRVRVAPVLTALGAQFIIAVLALKVDSVRYAILSVSDAILQLKQATLDATSFVFGYVGGGAAPFEVTRPGNAFVFAFQALPMVMIVSSIAMLLFHFRIMPLLVKVFSWFMQRALGVGGALGVCAAAKVFLGQTEAPLLIKPYLNKLSRSELFTVLTLGMATTASTVMVIYASILEGVLAYPISHILTASLISVPAAVAVSRVMIPQHETDTHGDVVAPYKFSSMMDAISLGAADGLKLFLNIIAMLVVMLALVSLINSVLGHVYLFDTKLSLQTLFGCLLSPIAWLMGIPWSEANVAGNLIGTKVALNEVMAFIELAKLPADALGEHSRLIMTYALCGFANLSSIGIQIGGIGTMVPERRAEIVALSARSMLAGTIANCLSGTIVGLLYALDHII